MECPAGRRSESTVQHGSCHNVRLRRGDRPGSGRDAEEVLAPKECEVSVLFCDLRGFVTTSESMADELFSLLQRVSSSLDVMTGKILKHGGVIGDFHGDSAMGFWGWPMNKYENLDRGLPHKDNRHKSSFSQKTHPFLILR